MDLPRKFNPTGRKLFARTGYGSGLDVIDVDRAPVPLYGSTPCRLT